MRAIARMIWKDGSVYRAYSPDGERFLELREGQPASEPEWNDLADYIENGRGNFKPIVMTRRYLEIGGGQDWRAEITPIE